MLKLLLTRLRQGHRTLAYPRGEPVLPDRFRGVPQIARDQCPAGCRSCTQACPVDAIAGAGDGLAVDLGRCLFCGDCASACPTRAIRYGRDHRMAARKREELVLREDCVKPVEVLDRETRRLFGRSLRLRQVSAAGCNACEADLNVLGTVVFDMARFGIQFVASPRHADGILVTGPVSANMRLALRKTYEAVPSPRLVIASGACAISGGPFSGHDEVTGGAAGTVPVDLFIPGCPPHPLTVLDGLLRLLGRLPE